MDEQNEFMNQEPIIESGNFDTQETIDSSEHALDSSSDTDAQQEMPEFSSESTEETAEDKPKKHRTPAKTRINQLTREKYQALDEVRRLQEENAYLKKQTSDLGSKVADSTLAAMSHYDNSVQLKLEKAKQDKVKAIESGDIQAQIDADVKLAEVAQEMHQINNWKAQESAEVEQYKNNKTQETNLNYQQPSPSQYQQPAVNQETINWLSKNTWLNPQSQDYNPELTKAIVDYSAYADEACLKAGRPDLIRSELYYQDLDEYVKHVTNPNKGERLSMKNSNGYVEPVGQSRTSQSTKQTVRLSPDARELIKRLGITEEAYIKEVRLSQNRNNSRGGW